MRDPIKNVVEMAELLGCKDLTQIEEWASLILVGLSVVDAPAPICFGGDITPLVFSLLLHEGLITPKPEWSRYPDIFGQRTFALTAAGEYVAEQYVSKIRTLH